MGQPPPQPPCLPPAPPVPPTLPLPPVAPTGVLGGAVLGLLPRAHPQLPPGSTFGRCPVHLSGMNKQDRRNYRFSSSFGSAFWFFPTHASVDRDTLVLTRIIHSDGPGGTSGQLPLLPRYSRSTETPRGRLPKSHGPHLLRPQGNTPSFAAFLTGNRT